MLENLTYEELCENIAFYSIYPFSEDRADMRNAQLAYHIVYGYAKDPKKLKLEDFILKFEPKQTKKQNWQQTLAIVTEINAALKGRDERRETKINDS